MTSARTILAAARGVTPFLGAGCRCAVCGPSPYDRRDAVIRFVGGNFTDYGAFQAPDAADICEGCATLLSGRPGDDPPPLRTRNVRASASRGLELLDRPGLWSALRDPLDEPHVVSWATSQQRHHWLRAGVSSSARLLVGSDLGTIEVTARHAPVLDAVHALLRSDDGKSPVLSREAIRTGHYHPAAVARYGVAAWRDHEAAVSVARGTLLLDLLTYCAPLMTERAPSEEASLIDPVDQRAATLLARIAQASRYRAEHGLQFWGGYYRHRIERFRRRSLSDLVSRLLDSCEASPTSDGALSALADLRDMTPDETAAVERAIRERPALLVGLAYDLIARERAA